MTWVPTEKEIASVLAADGPHRYEYFIHRVCEAKAVWALFNEGWASIGEDAGDTLILLWPHLAFAQAFAIGHWAGFQPRKVDLDDFLHDWIPGMRKAGVQPAVFAVTGGNAVVIPIEELEANLRHELSEVYGIED